MATTKRIYGDYVITNKGSNLATVANVTISTSTLFVDGNLVIGGNATAVSKTDLLITDNTILLNDGETGAGITLKTAGINIDRGTQPIVGVRYNEDPAGNGTLPAGWQATNDGSTWKYVMLSPSGPAGISKVEDDTAPKLGGNLNITGRTIYNTSANVTFYANVPNSGGTGIYANSISGTNQELITKMRSLIYTVLL